MFLYQTFLNIFKTTLSHRVFSTASTGCNIENKTETVYGHDLFQNLAYYIIKLSKMQEVFEKNLKKYRNFFAAF